MFSVYFSIEVTVLTLSTPVCHKQIQKPVYLEKQNYTHELHTTLGADAFAAS